RFAAKEGAAKGESLPSLFVNWALGIGAVYASLFSIGKLIFRQYAYGFSLLMLAAVFFVALSVRLFKENDRNA
ncbi:MAG TPA: hypothetical protein P5295_06780, partial [Spirochaetota bacterium]|nr:hypothetical protein [Spirochaetota bacterium]